MSKRLTVVRINRAVAAAGINAELVRNRDGYMWWVGPAVELARETAAGVALVSHRTLEQWVEDAQRIARESAANV